MPRCQELNDLLAGGLVKTACRLVGEDQLRLSRECARDGDALLFTSRKTRRTTLRLLAVESHQSEHFIVAENSQISFPGE
jgi:hypothetical protein